jgi:hypothetical protein
VNTLRKNKVTGLLEALTGAAGAVLVAAIVVSGDPLGLAIGALLGASIAVGIVGTLLRGSRFDAGAIRRGPRPNPLPLAYPSGPVAVATLSAFDASACACDEPAPDFAPVISLTEARVQRRTVERTREAAEA